MQQFAVRIRSNRLEKWTYIFEAKNGKPFDSLGEAKIAALAMVYTDTLNQYFIEAQGVYFDQESKQWKQ